MRIGVITNPMSRRGLGAADGLRAQWMLAKKGIDVVDLTGESAQDSLRKLQASVNEDLDAVLTVGGDGTVHIGVEGLAFTRVPLGIVAVGTGNDVARHFGLQPLDVEDNISRFLHALSSGKIRDIDVMTVGERPALAVLSAGVDAEINQLTNSYTWPQGTARYLRGIISGLAKHRPYGLRLEIDGRIAEGEATLISVANTSFYGAGLRIAPNASVYDGLLDVIVVRGLNRRELASLFLKLMRGTHVDHPLVHHLRGRTIRISAAPSLGKTPPSAMADGEFIGSFPVDITCHPHSLKLAL